MNTKKKYLAKKILCTEENLRLEVSVKREAKKPVRFSCSHFFLHWKQYELMHGYDRTITYYLLISPHKKMFPLKNAFKSLGNVFSEKFNKRTRDETRCKYFHILVILHLLLLFPCLQG